MPKSSLDKSEAMPKSSLDKSEAQPESTLDKSEAKILGPSSVQAKKDKVRPWTQKGSHWEPLRDPPSPDQRVRAPLP